MSENSEMFYFIRAIVQEFNVIQFIITYDNEKYQLVMFKKHETSKIWLFCLIYQTIMICQNSFCSSNLGFWLLVGQMSFECQFFSYF